MTDRTLIIAEAGVNHNGDLDIARRLVDAAARAGADIVKFQTFKADKLAAASAPQAAYQTRNTGRSESQLDMLRKLELSEDMHHALVEHCAGAGVTFLSTPFDIDSLRFLTGELKLPLIKLGSGEVTNGPLLLAAARTGLPLILSTGMAVMGEVEEALALLAFGYSNGAEAPTAEALSTAYADPAAWAVVADRVSLLHCTTEYPTPVADVNLRAMDALAEAFGVKVGFSDHTAGIVMPIAAVARGAKIVEKHFTLDRSMEGPDHLASLEPDELTAMVRGVRDVEAALGSGRKVPVAAERRNAVVARKSLIAAAPIAAGEVFTEANLGVKRPGSGVSPMRYWSLLGQTAGKDYRPDEPVQP